MTNREALGILKLLKTRTEEGYNSKSTLEALDIAIEGLEYTCKVENRLSESSNNTWRLKIQTSYNDLMKLIFTHPNEYNKYLVNWVNEEKKVGWIE